MIPIYVIELVRYIVKSSFELRALLSCYDPEKVERTKAIKKFVLILWMVTTSHIESMRHKSC